MKLYTINGVYPDANFHFSVTAEDLGIVPEIHTHGQTIVDGLDTALNGLAASNHTHVMVHTLYATNMATEATVVGLSVSATSGSATPTASISGQTITLNYNTPQTGLAAGIADKNPRAPFLSLQLYGGAVPAVVSTDFSYVGMSTRNLLYKDCNYREFYNNVLLADSTADTRIVKILDVTKTNGVLVPTEIYPCNAVRMFISTNYDKKEQALPANCVYGVPVINTEASDYQPLRVTVEPIPEYGYWKLICSDNMTLPASARGNFSGKQTLSIPIIPDTEEQQERWVAAVPADDDGWTPPVKFKFFVKPSATGGQSSGGGSSGSQEPVSDEDLVRYGNFVDDVIYYWGFENPQQPLTDNINGGLLSDYHNLSNPADHIKSDIAVYGTKSLGAIDAGAQLLHILADDKLYVRMSALDQNDRFGWYNEDQVIAVYTASATPVANDPIYDSPTASDPITDLVVEDCFTPTPNTWETTLDLVDTTGYVTFSLYVKGGSNNGGFEVNFLGGHWLDFKWGWKWGFHWGNGINANVDTWPTLQDGWKHFAVVIKKSFKIRDADMLYDANIGRGLEVFYGPSSVRQGESGNTRLSGYYRDSAKDDNGRFAWTYSGDSTPEYATIWTDAETYETGSWITDHTFTDATGNTKVNCQWYLFRWRFRNDFVKYSGDSNAGATGPWYSSWSTSDYNDNNTDSWIYIEYYLNGKPDGWALAQEYSGKTDTLKLWIGDLASRVDDIRVYSRALSPSEIANLATLKGEADAPVVVVDTSLTDSKIDVEQARTKVNPIKMTVGDSVYIYDPESTVYKPTSDNDKAARFGYEKISGTGPDHYWLDTLAPTAILKCYAQPDDLLPDVNAPVSAVETLKPADIPLNLHLEPFIIDEQTVAIIVGTWDFLVKRLRALYPDIEMIHYNHYQGKWPSGNYKAAGSWGFNGWDTQATYQPEIRKKLDDVENYAFDGEPVTIRGRFFEELSHFHPAYFQWRNCKPGDKWYVPPEGKNMWVNNYWNNGMDNVHVAYLRLGTPMTEGSTHTLTWCESSCTFKYDKAHYSAAIKVNQEGYIAWRGARYAYVGRWLGSGEAWSLPTSDRTFYLLPATDSATVSDAVFSGTMQVRCSFKNQASGGITTTDVRDGRPLDGENCYQCDLSGYTSCTKAVIVAGGTEYFRDIDADWDRAILTADGTDYTRDPTKDTCNAWAWVEGGTNTVYTDTHYPVAGTDQIRDTWEPGTGTTYVDITGVTSYMRYGWTTERVTEVSYGTAHTVWTNTELAGESMGAYQEDGTQVTITGSTTKQTNDISGNYQVYVPHVGYSHVFNIGNQGFGHIFWVHARGLFHQRSGCDYVKHPYTNWEYDWGGHSPVYYGGFPSWATWNTQSTSNIWRVDPVTKEPELNEDGGKIGMPASGSDAFALGSYLSGKNIKNKQEYGVYGGWFDAADFDIRPYHLYIPGYLADAYIYWPQNFEDNQLDIPESGDGIPDILSEALWGMEVYRKCQYPDGGCTAEIETSGHEKDWPWLSTMKYFRGCGEFQNTASYCSRAAELAYALRVSVDHTDNPEWKAKRQKLADIYTESALRAWSYVEAEFESAWVMKADADRPHRYITFQDQMYELRENLSMNDEPGVNSENCNYVFQCAVALYRLTRLPKFRSWITLDRAKGYFYKAEKNDNWWTWCDNLFALVKGIDDEFPEVSTWVKNRFVQNAQKWYNRQFENTYRILYWKPSETWFKAAGWGCCHPDIRGTLYVLAYLATNDTKWLDALALAFDHVTGCNALGRTWTAHLGKVYPFHCLDSHEPRNRVQRGLFGLRQGISPYLWTDPTDMPWDEIKYAIYPTSGTRWDFFGADNGWSYSMYPAHANLVWGSIAGASTGQAMLKRNGPAWRMQPIFVGEDIHVSGSEYVVDQTIGFKMMMAGILMGPGFKPKPWYKQAAPAKGYYGDPNWCTLP